MASNRTPSDVIADGRKIKAAVAHLLNDEHLAVFDAMLAMADVAWAYETMLNSASDAAIGEWNKACQAAHTALLAAGVEVENG